MSSEQDSAGVIASIDELVDTMRAGEKPPSDWKVGTEHEKIGLHAGDASLVEYGGERGIGALLESMAETGGWESVTEGDHVIALLLRDQALDSLSGLALDLVGAPEGAVPGEEPRAENGENEDASDHALTSGSFAGRRRRTSARRNPKATSSSGPAPSASTRQRCRSPGST